MSNQEGAPPRGAPRAGAYGPGQTVLAGSGYDAAPPARSAGVPIPPTTVRDPHTDHGGAPVYPPAPYDLPPPYGAPESPYGGADARFDAAPEPPRIGVPPPPRARGRSRKSGPSLAVIGVVSFVIIGSSVTAIALIGRPSGDEKPAPTVEVPAPTSPPPDPVASAAPTEQPAASPPPGPAQRALPRPGQLRPGGRPGRPGNYGPGPNGPNGPFNPRSPPRRPR